MEFTRYGAITLNFQDGKFEGWFLGNEPGADAYSTRSGIAVGTARAKAAESVTIVDIEDNPLRDEFRIGTGGTVIGRVLDGKSVVLGNRVSVRVKFGWRAI